jgi:NAD(P)-dependent dehydrogenase (short-subunit alcohol dehydrogenase family)
VQLWCKTQDFKKLNLPLHALINNAGIMMGVREVTKVCATYSTWGLDVITWCYLAVLGQDGFETMFQANHLSHFLLTNLLLPELEKTG